MEKHQLSKELFAKDSFLVGCLIALSIVLYFLNLSTTDLLGRDEPRYAEVAREMLEDGQWIVPHFNGEVYFDKPPLYFWMAAAISAPFGTVTEFTSRLPSAFTGLGAVLLVFLLGKKLFSQRAGFLAAVMLATCPEFQQLACTARIDVALTFFVTLSFTAFYLGYTSNLHKRRWYLLSWFAMSLGVLTKGHIAVFTVGSVFLYLLWNRELRKFKETEIPLGGLVFLLPWAGWLFLVYAQEGYDFLKNFLLINTGLAYFAVPHEEKNYYLYLPALFTGAAPWAFLSPIVLYFAIFKKWPEKTREFSFLGAWFIVLFVLLNLGESKRAAYILPLYPAVILAVGALVDRYFDGSGTEWLRRGLVPVYLLAILLGIELALLPSKHHFSPLIVAISSAVFIALVYFYSRAKALKALFFLLFLIIASFEMTHNQVILREQSKKKSEKLLCLQIKQILGKDSAWAVYKSHEKAYPFYTKRYPRQIMEEQELASFLNSPEKVYCLMTQTNYAIVANKSSMFLVREFPPSHREKSGLVLVSNRPAD